MTSEEVREKGWPAIFGAPHGELPRLVVEIGFCRGEFLMDLAQQQPDSAFVGIECSHKRVLKMARRLALTPIENMRLVEGFAEAVVGELFEERSVSEFWINFPDPWPKRNHARRRIIRGPFVELFASRLAPGGCLHVATDDRTYCEQMQQVLSSEPLLENLWAPQEWLSEIPGRMPTAYELEWRAQDRPLHFFAYRRAVD